MFHRTRSYSKTPSPPSMIVEAQQLHNPSAQNEIQAPITKLPAELLLSIADWLEKDSRILFSLSCGRVHNILRTSKLDLSTSFDIGTRLQVSRCLERDRPQHLACRQCGILFKWRRRFYAEPDIVCDRPNEIQHPPEERVRDNMDVIDDGLSSRFRCVTANVVELALRRQEWGPGAGIAITFLNRRILASSDAAYRAEARWVGKQLMVHMQWTYNIALGLDRRINFKWRHWKLCRHGRRSWYARIAASGNLADHDSDPPREFTSEKCRFCATDVGIYTAAIPAAVSKRSCRIIVRVWQNYGGRDPQSADVKQMFDRNPKVQIDDESLKKRDLKSLFESGKRKEGDVK